MADIDKIKQKIADSYRTIDKQPQMQVPLVLQVQIWISFAKEYLDAAVIVTKEKPQYMLPILQLTGQAIESSIKACLASANTEPPNIHDLVKLYRLSEKHGFQLDDLGIAAIVHLQHFFFQDLATGTRYKSRYPTKTNERLGGAIPSIETFISVAQSLIEQADSRCPINT